MASYKKSFNGITVKDNVETNSKDKNIIIKTITLTPNGTENEFKNHCKKETSKIIKDGYLYCLKEVEKIIHQKNIKLSPLEVKENNNFENINFNLKP